MPALSLRGARSIMINAITLLTLTLSLLLTVRADQPSPVQEFAFARLGSKLLVYGGKYASNNSIVNITGQLYALDLSTSWPVASAPWTSLTPGVSNYFMQGASTPNNQTLQVFMVGPNNTFVISRYSLNTNSWDPSPTVLLPDTDYRNGMRSITDPASGLVYINAFQNMDVFNPSTSTIALSSIPANVFSTRLFSGATYVKSRNSIMYYGGETNIITFDPTATAVTEYSLTTHAWSNFTTVGQPPQPRSDFCMTSSEDGNTVIVFGGRIDTNMSATPPSNYTGTLHLLNTQTGAWTQAPSGETRLYMACLVVGDQFLAWGGFDGLNTHTGPPVVFSLTTGQWVTSYTAPDYYLNAPKTTTGGTLPTNRPNSPSTSAPATSSSKNLGAILGGVFGGLLVIALAGVIYMYLKRREDKIRYGLAPKQQNEEHTDANSPQMTSLQHPSGSVRDPQDASSLGTSGAIFVSPIDDKLQYTVSHKDSSPPMTSPHSFGSQPGQPVMYIPNAPYGAAGLSSLPTQAAFVPVGGNGYIAYTTPLSAGAPDLGMYASTGVNAYANQQYSPYGTPMYATGPIPGTHVGVLPVSSGVSAYVEPHYPAYSAPVFASTIAPSHGSMESGGISYIHNGSQSVPVTIGPNGQMYVANPPVMYQPSPPTSGANVSSVGGVGGVSPAERNAYVEGQSGSALTLSPDASRFGTTSPGYSSYSGLSSSPNFDTSRAASSGDVAMTGKTSLDTPPLSSNNMINTGSPSAPSIPRRPVQSENVYYTATVTPTSAPPPTGHD
ncbi:hypothetical protein BGZ99_004397 [Dissophora globulifera]|uniref:Galactose oxidase n=1 Tax=Dissophora globulifera TaxID=979702 RepID=A0A9P6RI34_9FUNG|nr:hypothetical protein BGZ99_004397 [Dissophora globulifera]